VGLTVADAADVLDEITDDDLPCPRHAESKTQKVKDQRIVDVFLIL
jgi:hypothetical protein